MRFPEDAIWPAAPLCSGGLPRLGRGLVAMIFSKMETTRFSFFNS